MHRCIRIRIIYQTSQARSANLMLLTAVIHFFIYPRNPLTKSLTLVETLNHGPSERVHPGRIISINERGVIRRIVRPLGLHVLPLHFVGPGNHPRLVPWRSLLLHGRVCGIRSIRGGWRRVSLRWNCLLVSTTNLQRIHGTC